MEKKEEYLDDGQRSNSGSSDLGNSSRKESAQNIAKTKRRTRNESTLDRNYTCGCGKSYLSYPALYLHLKNKHEGKPPEGTLLPNANGKAMRGRPKKDDQEKKEDNQIGISKVDSGDEVINEIVNFFDNLGKHLKREEKVNVHSPEFYIKLLEVFPKDLLGKQEDYEKIYKNLEMLLKGDGSVESDCSLIKGQPGREDSYQDLKDVSCNKIFAFFLMKMSKWISYSAFRELAFFICLYRKVLNEIGWKYAEKLNPDLNYSPEQEFSEVNNGEFILEVANEFIIDYLPIFLQDYNTQSLKILGLTTGQMKNAVYLAQYFSNWLFNNNFTNSKLMINDES